MIIADDEETLKKGEQTIMRVIYAGDEERNKIRSEQLKVAEEINTSMMPFPVDESMMTPYGPPSPYVNLSYPNLYRLISFRFLTILLVS